MSRCSRFGLSVIALVATLSACGPDPGASASSRSALATSSTAANAANTQAGAVSIRPTETVAASTAAPSTTRAAPVATTTTAPPATVPPKLLAKPGKSLRLPSETSPIKLTALALAGQRVVVGDSAGALWLVDDSLEGVPFRQSGPHASSVNTVAASADGRLVVSGADDGLRIWSVNGASGALDLVTTVGGARTGAVRSLAISDTGDYLVAGSTDGKLSYWSLARTTAPEQEHTVLVDNSISRVAAVSTWSSGPPPTLLLLLGAGDVQAVLPGESEPRGTDARTKIHGLTGPIEGGGCLVAGADGVWVVDADLRRNPVLGDTGHPTPYAVAASRLDGRRVAAIAGGIEVGTAFDLDGTRTTVSTPGPTARVSALVFDHLGARLVAADLDGKLWSWSLAFG